MCIQLNPNDPISNRPTAGPTVYFRAVELMVDLPRTKRFNDGPIFFLFSIRKTLSETRPLRSFDFGKRAIKVV